MIHATSVTVIGFLPAFVRYDIFNVRSEADDIASLVQHTAKKQKIKEKLKTKTEQLRRNGAGSAYPHDISKTDAVGITRLDMEMFHRESWTPIYLGSRSRSAKRKPYRRVFTVSVLFFSSEVSVERGCQCRVGYWMPLPRNRPVRYSYFPVLERFLCLLSPSWRILSCSCAQNTLNQYKSALTRVQKLTLGKSQRQADAGK